MARLWDKEQKRLAQQFLLRRLQIVLFSAYLTADVATSCILFLKWPGGEMFQVPSATLVYAFQHLVWLTIVVSGMAVCWWMVGNHAYWSEQCRSHELGKVFLMGGIWGIGLNVTATLFNRSFPLSSVFLYSATRLNSPVIYLGLRTLLWAALYTLSIVVFLRILEPHKHIEELHRHRRTH